MNGLNILRKSIRLNLLPFSLMQLQEVCMKQPFNSTIHGAGWGSAYGEPEYYNLDGYNIDFKIPFAGDSILLKCQPSTYTFTSYEIVDFQRSTESSYGYITIRLSYTKQEIKSFGEQLEEKIDTAFKNRFKNFEETSGYVNNEVRSYNEQLESTVRQLLNERKK